jgi:hypothetical protein
MIAKVRYTIVTTLLKASLTYSVSVVNTSLAPLLKMTTISLLQRHLATTIPGLPAATCYELTSGIATRL